MKGKVVSDIYGSTALPWFWEALPLAAESSSPSLQTHLPAKE